MSVNISSQMRIYAHTHMQIRIHTYTHLSQCDRVSATRAFITQLGERDVRHMIIGPGCSNGAVTVAENAPFRSLTQVNQPYYWIEHFYSTMCPPSLSLSLSFCPPPPPNQSPLSEAIILPPCMVPRVDTLSIVLCYA